MRPSRRAAIAVALVAAAVLAAIALGWFPQAPLHRLLESRLQALIGPGSRIGGLSVVPGRLSAEIRGLVLDAPTYRLEADRVLLALSRETLLREGLFVNRLEMEGGHVTLRTPGKPLPPARPPPAPLVIHHVDISGATLSIENEHLGGTVVLHPLEVRGSVGEGVLAATAAGGAWQRGEPLSLGPVSARLRISPRLELHLESLDAGLERSRLQASGALGRIGDLRPDVRFEVRADLSEIGRLAGIAPAAGIVAGEGRLWGPLDTLAVEARLAGERLRASAWPVDRLRAEVKHDTGTGVTSGSGRMSLLGGEGRFEARLSGNEVRGALTASGLDLGQLVARASAGAPVATGTAGGTMRFEGDPGRRVTVDAEAEASGRDRNRTRFHARARARGPVRLPSRELDLVFSAALDAEPAPGGPMSRGRLSATGSLRGAATAAIEAKLDGTLALTTAEGPVPVTVAGSVRTRADHVRTEIQLSGIGGTAEGTAEMIGTNVRALELAGRRIDLAHLAQAARGEAEFQLQASGPVGALSGTARARVEGLGWRDVSLGALQADLEATRGDAQLHAELPRLGASADARLVRGEQRALRGTLSLVRSPLGVIAPLLPEGMPLEGALTGTATFDMPLATLGEASAEGRIEMLEVTSGGLVAHAAAPFSVGLATGRVKVEGLHLEGQGLKAQVDASGGTAAGDPLDVRASVEADLGLLPAPEAWTLGGGARASVTVDGTTSSPRARGFVLLQDVALASPAAPTIRVEAGRLELEGDAVRIPDLNALVAGGTVRVEGRVPIAAFWRGARRAAAGLAPEEEARLAIEWSGLQARELLGRLSSSQQAAVEATLAGRADLSGGLNSLAEARGTLTLPATTLHVEDLPLELAPAEVRLEAGRISAESVQLHAAGGSLRLAGSVDLRSRALDLSGNGTLELRALSPFLAEAALTGTSVVDLRVLGTLEGPRPVGVVRVKDGTLRLRALPQALTGLVAEIFLDGSTLRLQNASARLGGGELAASGSAQLDGTGLSGARFALTGRDLALRYPEGMRSRLEAELALTGGSGAFQLSGTVRAQRGIYDLDTALEGSLRAPARESADSPLLRSVSLDLQVFTDNPVLVRNNLAQLQATGRLAVRGDLQTPAPIGSLDIASGGKVFIQGRDFVIGSGRLAYSGTWDPELSLEAVARIPDLDPQTGNKRADVSVTVGLEGPLSAPRLSLRSDPAYTKPEIVNLIATGDSQNPSARLAVGGSAATLLLGRLTRSLGGLGLDAVSIQPELVAREGGVETGARFTFGKRLSERVNLVYSLSLQDPEGRFIQVEASPGRDVALSVRRTDSGSFTYGAGQRFRLGGTAPPSVASEQRVRVAEVRLEGDRPLEPDELRALLRVGPGARKTVWDLQDDADGLRERLVERGYLEAEVGARFEGQVAVFSVRSGSRYGWRVDGMADPPDLARIIRSALFEEEALERGRSRLLEELWRRGHLRARVEARAVAGEARTLVFEVQPGPVLQAEVSFPGASALPAARLLEAAGGAGRLLADPDAAVRDILAAYRDALHLGAEVDPPRVREEAGGARLHVSVPVREGPRARLLALRFEGAALEQAELARVAGLETGTPYEPSRAAAAVDRLRSHYFGLGYPAVRVNPRLDTRGKDVELVFQVAEGGRVTVGAVVLRGLRHVREGLVRRQVNLRPGDPLDPRKLAELERRLLDLGLFTRAAAAVSEDNPATVTLTLEEGERIRAGYLLSYNDDRGSRAELDGELRNLLGAGIAAGGRLSAGPDVLDARAAFSIPPLLAPTGRLTASLFRLREDLPLVARDEGGPTFERIQSGGQIQGTRPLGDRWNLLYGYRFKSVSVTSEFLSSSHRVAGLDVSLLRDTRDNPLDARRGRFWSLSLELSPRALGSDFDFVKGFGQAFLNRPLTGSLSWAQGYRLGLAHAFRGEPLVPDEGFEAGGSNSIRAFAAGEVGPEGYPFGRQAVVVVNQELRYRHRSGLGGVLFYDAGNTFATPSDLSLRLRHVLGAGLRWSSPVGLLRVDLGASLFPRAGEARYKLFFSLGQAF